MTANVNNTTGAAALLIRSYIRINKHRVAPFHVILFIFIVANCGGCLTPIGDPPLFLGYLQGIEFTWTLWHCFPAWAVVMIILLALFFTMDVRAIRRYEAEPDALKRDKTTIWIGGSLNFVFLGVVLVVASKDLIEKGRKDIPKIFQFRTHADNKSLYNTPPTFGIYMVRNVLSWIKGQGGLPKLEEANRKKASRLYGVIDANSRFYRSPAEKESRSTMNVVFRLPSPELEDQFIAEAKKRGMVGLKGHRSVGGIRASIYNAVPYEWVDTLAGFMEEFQRGK